MRIFKPKKALQTVFVYCPMCKLELCKNGQLISDDRLGVKFSCKRCNCTSKWDFDTPAPILLEHSIQTTRLYDYDYKNPNKYRKFASAERTTNL
jgi:Zn-finger protein